MSDFDLSPIRQGSLTDRAVATLLDHIVGSRLAPGVTLPSVADLSERLGVSRPVIREAMNALKALGVIDVATGKKAVVRGLDGDVLRVYFERAVQRFDGSLREVMDVRIGVESRAAALAARNRSDKDLAALHALLREMRSAQGAQAVPAGGRAQSGMNAQTAQAQEKFSRADAAMHLEIARASGNSLMLHIVESLDSALRKATLLGLRAMAGGAIPARIVEEHAALVAAIEARDEARAEAIMRDHIAAALERLT